MKVLCDICGYDREDRLFVPYMYPLGRHFEDGILTIWHDKKGEEKCKY